MNRVPSSFARSQPTPHGPETTAAPRNYFPVVDPEHAEPPLVFGGQGRDALETCESALITAIALFVAGGLVWFAVMFRRSL